MRTTVAVIGGGYGGIAAAKALDAETDVMLVEPRDTFVHNVAALRGLVDPVWIDRMFLPYERLLDRGRVVRDRAVRVSETTVTLGSGERLTADYLVLATGSAYPFPAKVDVDDSAAAKARFENTHRALADAGSVLLLGAGPVGLELAGEIKAAWPDKVVSVVDPSDDILSGGYGDAFRTELRRQLTAMGVDLLLGTTLREPPPTEPGEAKTFTATTRSGREITADIWFRCFGVVPSSGYLAGALASARRPSGQVEVTPELRLPGQRHVFALGDMTAIPEPKQASAATAHADVVVANIRTLLEHGTRLTGYEPGPPGIVLPLGPAGGATHASGWDSHLAADTVVQIRAAATGRSAELLRHDVLDAATTSMIKGADLNVSDYAAFLGLE